MNQLFAGLGLSAELTRAVADQGYTHPTPIQAQAIPIILAGRDVLAGAQTGTGKTAAFTLPLLQRLGAHANRSFSPARHPVRALVLAPTRELAAQVEESVRKYGKHTALKSTLVFGGVNINPQIAALRRGVDILVATPGRLLDHVQQKTVALSRVEILVLDEADRMLDMGFIRDIRRIISLLPAKRQNLLFSATFSSEIRELADGLLRDPVSVQVARRNADCELVAQRAHPVSQANKRHLLAHLVASGDWRQVLVFTRTKHGANRLSDQLSRGAITSTAIHGNKSQPARNKALADFKAGAVRVLVATDVAARGLDIDALPHVVNFDLPHVAEDYIHRIGRTGRAGSTGVAVSLVAPEERPLLAAIEKLLGRRIEQQVVTGFKVEEPPVEHGARKQNGTHPVHNKASGTGWSKNRPNRPAMDRSSHEGRPTDKGQRSAPARNRDETRPATTAGTAYPSSERIHGETGTHGGSGTPRRARSETRPPHSALLHGTRRRAA